MNSRKLPTMSGIFRKEVWGDVGEDLLPLPSSSKDSAWIREYPKLPVSVILDTETDWDVCRRSRYLGPAIAGIS
jgi:hypothetical protein